MIEVRLKVTITAEDDRQADEIIYDLRRHAKDWPELPLVAVVETDRYEVEDER
jgi:hypothetical protein